MNWRGKPLTSYEVIVNLIAATTTSKGLKVKCMLDKNEYPKGIHWSSVKEKVSILLSILYNLTILNSHNGTSVIRYS